MQTKSNQEIIKNWAGNLERPMVSICSITYNHENFIRQTLDSFLIQETNFPFEVIINDDASEDRTAKILKEYQEKFPDIIKPIFQTENQYSQGRKTLPIVFSKAKGKYIAICEGDDYWVDPHKLQIQVDFLKNNPDYILSFHNASIIDQDGHQIKESKLPVPFQKDFNKEDLIFDKARILTLSALFRNVISQKMPKELNKIVNEDTLIFSILGQYGKSKYQPEIQPACYRQHPKGVWSLLPKQERLDEIINTYFWIYRYYQRIGEKSYSQYYLTRYYALVMSRISFLQLSKELIKHIFRPVFRLFRPSTEDA